ncbi:hypothetical protein F4779DRAFT_341240 [Xylariaceae sp. FL0662B]|nr:hypothetical protein F4779DRAFT_341240 [Xylariaceae sp. FL0662B]
MRDNEISKAIFRMNEDRQRNPGYWQPVPPIPASMRPGQPNWQQTPQSVMNRHVPASVPEHPLPTVIYYPPNDPPITPQAKPPANHGPAQSKTGPSAVGAPPGQSKSPAAPSNMGQRPIPSMAGGADTNGIVTEHSDEPKEQSCNFTWVLDRAETHLGWTGNYDKFSEIRQISTGYNVAFKLQKLLKKMDAMVEKYVTFPNRVHILTVMREVMMATLETDSVVGRECRECSREYDSTFLASVQRLTPTQKQKLKVLEGGRWMEEFKALIDEANRQAMFPLLERANAVIDG